MEGVVQFHMDEELLHTLEDGNKSSLYFNPQVIQKTECQVRVWHKLIERVQFLKVQELFREIRVYSAWYNTIKSEGRTSSSVLM